MTEYTEQTSASDRYAAARKALDHYFATPTHDAKEWALRAVPVAKALEALITPPGVHESKHDAAMRIAADYFPESRGTAYEAAARGVRAGIQNAHETWEPEVALRPTQEQMLRWLGIEHEEDPAVGMLYVREQYIEREDD